LAKTIWAWASISGIEFARHIPRTWTSPVLSWMLLQTLEWIALWAGCEPEEYWEADLNR
jgi:hypothetical protein